MIVAEAWHAKECENYLVDTACRLLGISGTAELWIEFDHIERHQLLAIVDRFGQCERFPKGEATGDGCAGRFYKRIVHGIDIEANMQPIRILRVYSIQSTGDHLVYAFGRRSY